MKGEVKEQPLKNVLSDSEYVDQAKAFLDNHNLSKPGMELKGVNHGYTIERYNDKGELQKDEFRIEVMFISPPVNGIKYTGVGPKISVWFGDNGKVIGYGSIWRELELPSSYPLISVDNAKQNIMNGKALIYNISGLENEGILDSAEVVLWSDPDGMSQEYAIPHYIFKGKNKDGQAFTIVTRAIAQEYLTEQKPTQNEQLPLPEMTQKQ